jgi:hypothetical protein
MISGQAIFFDGKTAARHDVTVEVAPTRLRVLAPDGAVLAEWPYDELEPLSAPEEVLRIGRYRNPVLARLEVRDPQLAAAIDDLSIPVDRTGENERRGRHKVVLWSVVATLSLLVVAVFGVPEIATRLTPYIPYSVERRLGDAVEKQIRGMLDTRHTGAAFECGQAQGEQPGRTAFATLIASLEGAAGLPIPLRVAVVRRPEANAITLPGGRIYVFEGLIDKSESPDELAGVIAHEFGHVVHRDGTRLVLQSAGLSLLFGMLLGDFVGGGAVIIAGRAILQSNYSRGRR